jgi:FkbM family methyltransferase
MAVPSANVAQDLIFDVGASNGDDSAYYLHKGYRVVAVEPNPVSAALLRTRFASEIEAGSVSLVEAAVSGTDGEAPFWLCEDVPGWSSFDKVIAGYQGSRHRSISVSTCRYSTLVEQFGIPFYCKIDIEGADRLCLEAMAETTRSPFVSLELPTIGSAPADAETAAILSRIEALGYTRFKVISQVTYRQPSGRLAAIKARLPASLSRRVTLLDARLRKHSADGDFVFGEESSGPFAEETRGAWLDAARLRQLVAIIRRNRDLSDWYDIHAALPA